MYIVRLLVKPVFKLCLNTFQQKLFRKHFRLKLVITYSGDI